MKESIVVIIQVAFKRIMVITELFRKVRTCLIRNPLIVFFIAILLYSILSPIWMGPDGIFNLAASIKGASNPLAVYDEWLFGGPFFYARGPFYSWLLLLAHPIFKFLGFTAQSVWEGWAFNPFTYYLFKWLIKIPFILAGGYLFYRMYGLRAAVLWLFNPLIIWFIILIGLNDIYPAFFLILGIYFLKKNRLLPFIIAIGFGLLSKQTIILAFPAIILMLIFMQKRRSIIYLIALFLPHLIFTLPYRLYSSTCSKLLSYVFWVRWPLHLGSISGIQNTNLILYACLLGLFIMRKPKLTLRNFCLWSLPFFLIYMLSSGIMFERYFLTALPLLIVVTILFSQLYNKNIYLLFWGLSFLPTLIQFGWRDAYFKMNPECYTLFENTALPFRLLNIFKRSELAPNRLAGYFQAIQFGLIIVFLLMIAYAIYKIVSVNKIGFQQENYFSPRLKRQLSLSAGGVFILGLSILFFFSPTYKFSDEYERNINLKGESCISLFSPDGSVFQKFEIVDARVDGNTLKNINIISNGDFENFANEKQPDGWIPEDEGVSIERINDPDKVKKNLYAVSVTSSDNYNGMISQTINVLKESVGTTVKLTAWVWAKKSGCIVINDGNEDHWAYHPGDSKYHELSLTYTINEATKKLRIALWVSFGKYSAIFDDVRVNILGNSAQSVSMSPNVVNIYPSSFLRKIDGITYTVKYRYKSRMRVYGIFFRERIKSSN